MSTVLYYILYGVFYVVSLLPFRVLYALSDGAYVLLYHVTRYRRKVVRKNLTNSFPEKSLDEIREIERGFYHWLCDYLNETIKLLSVSEEKLHKHLELRGLDIVEDYFGKGRTCSVLLGHYCNWEWLSATSIGFVRHKEAITGLIYHPLFNKAFDRLFLKIRQSMGGTCIAKNDILRCIVQYRREGKKTLMGYIADQCPKWTSIHLWIEFMNQDTPVFTGGEKIMRSCNDAVFYLEMKRPERGKYVATFKLMTDNPAALEEFAITRMFFSLLEAQIKEAPQYYLWSHNRWKRKRDV